MLTLSADERGTRQYFGKYSGVVLEHDEELPEANALRGDIRVEVAGILEEDDAGAPRPMQVVAKPAFPPGFFFIPEPGEKVWVEFVAGEVDYAIWSGAWYPDDRSPATRDGERPTRFQKVIRTASGHVVQLDDTEGAESVSIVHKGGAEVTIDENGSMLLANESKAFLFLNAKDGETTLADEHGCFITLKADGAVISAKDGTIVEIKDGTVQVLAGTAVTVSAQDIVLKGGSIALGDGASEPAMLGLEFMNIFLTHTHGSAMGPTTPPMPVPGNMLGPAPVGKGLSNIVKVAK